MTVAGTIVVVGDVIDDIIVRPQGAIRTDTDTPALIERHPGGSSAADHLAAHIRRSVSDRN